MAMRGFISRHSGVVQVVAAVAATLSLAFYVHEVEGSGFADLGAWNLLLLIPMGLLALGETARRIDGRSGAENTNNSINCMIEAMVRGYVFPDNWGDDQYRAYCHQIDKRGSQLKPVAVASHIPGVEERSPLPISGSAAKDLVIAEAFNRKTGVFREVSAPPEDLGIWNEVKTVIAVPILDVDDDSALGTISVDTSLPKNRTQFANVNTAAVLLNVAKAVALLWRHS
jgi:hypothetical protein